MIKDIMERVINGVDHCSQNGCNCDGCEYKGIQDCVTWLMQDVRNVLHEIEAKQPIAEQDTIIQTIIAALEKANQYNQYIGKVNKYIKIESENGKVTITIAPWQKRE